MPSLLLLLLFLGLPAFAGTFNYMGFGAANQSMANSTVAVPADGFSHIYNPSLMAFQKESTFSLGLQGAVTSFNSVNQIVIDNPSLGGTAVTTGNVNTATEDAFLYALAYQTILIKGERPWHLGLNLSFPVKHIFEVNTPDAYQPQYSMYLTNTQLGGGGLALGVALSDQWALGFGGSFFYTQGITTRTRLPASGNSTSRMAGEIKLGIAPVAGVTFSPDDKNKVGLSFRGKHDYQTQVDVDTTLNLLNPADLFFTSSTSVGYDPDMILLGGSHLTESQDLWALALKWEHWGAYQNSAIRLNFQTFTGSFSQNIPQVQFHDIVTYHLGYEHPFSSSKVRAGYAFVPTPVPNPNTVQDSNVLDSDKHEIYVGWGTKWDKTFLDGTLLLDIVGFFDYLVPYSVTKTNSQAIGYPGYNIGGKIYGYGITLTRDY